jgi:hypothetical protein
MLVPPGSVSSRRSAKKQFNALDPAALPYFERYYVRPPVIEVLAKSIGIYKKPCKTRSSILQGRVAMTMFNH